MTDLSLTDLAGAASDKGPVRKANEDAFMLPEEKAPTELGLIYVVADGVGGQEHGAEASHLAARIIHDVFYQTRQVGESIPVALAHAADQANLAIYDEAQKRQASRMGCTVVTAVHHEGQRYILHAGDARAYLLRDGQLKKLTRDDTWVQRQVEEGLIGEDTAQHHELRHVVTRVLGNNPTAEFTVSDPAPIAEGDVLLLCSDGLHDVVEQSEMQQILAGYSPQAAADTLVKTAVQNKAQDNITALVVRSQPDKESDATVVMPTAARPTAAQAAPTVAISPAPPPAADPAEPARSARPRAGIRLPLWALGLIVLAIIGGFIIGLISVVRQFRAQPSADPLPTAATIATSPAVLATAVPAGQE
ncbi:MAG: protein phosphatase 2C domain-containing protein, partial [Anaerolineae bacterium]